MIAPLQKTSSPDHGRKQSRNRRRTNRTRRKLLDAARSAFAERGLDSTTIDDITQRADVGKGTFYYHFKGKEDLITALVEDMMSELTERLQDSCRSASDLSELMDAMIRVHIEFFSTRWEDFVLYYQGRADLTLVQNYEGIETPFMEYLNCIASLVDDSTSVPISDPVLRRLACAIAGFISGYYSFAVIASEGEDVDKAFASMRSAFVASLVRFVKTAVPDSGNQEGHQRW